MSDVKWNEGFDEELRMIILKKLALIAGSFQRKIQEMFRMPKSGRWYARRTVRHRASAPGEAPAKDLGFLAKSVTHQVTQAEGAFYLDIGPSLQSGRSEIAAMLEFGTSKMAPRPSWRPALEAVAAETDQQIVLGEA